MKTKLLKLVEVKPTSNKIKPKGAGWKYDGPEYSIRHGKIQNVTHYWNRENKDVCYEECYKLRRRRPKGKGWKLAYTHIVGPTKQRRRIWRRLFELKRV